MKPYLPRRMDGVSFYDPRHAVQRPVFGIDVDGTLCEYHDHFIEFAEAWLGKPIRRRYDGSVPLAKWCGVSRTRYRQIKLAYRQGGLKRSIPVYPGADDLTRTLRKRGALVVICTTRPYLHLSNIEPDTKELLRRNGIQHDGILFGEHKYRDLAWRYGRRVVMVLDDLPEMMQQATDASLPAVLRSQPYNSNFDWSPRVHGLDDALGLGLQLLDTWEGEYR